MESAALNIDPFSNQCRCLTLHYTHQLNYWNSWGFLDAFSKIAESDFQLPPASLPVCPSAYLNSAPTERFSWSFILETREILYWGQKFRRYKMSQHSLTPPPCKGTPLCVCRSVNLLQPSPIKDDLLEALNCGINFRTNMRCGLPKYNQTGSAGKDSV